MCPQSIRLVALIGLVLIITCTSGYPARGKQSPNSRRGNYRSVDDKDKAAGIKKHPEWYPTENDDDNSNGKGPGSIPISMKDAITELFKKWHYKDEDIPKPFGQLDPDQPLRNPDKSLITILTALVKKLPQDLAVSLKTIIDRTKAPKEESTTGAVENTDMGEDSNKEDESNAAEKDESMTNEEEQGPLSHSNFDTLCPDDHLVNTEKKLDLLIAELSHNGDVGEGQTAVEMSPSKVEHVNGLLKELEKETKAQWNLEQKMETLTNFKPGQKGLAPKTAGHEAQHTSHGGSHSGAKQEMVPDRNPITKLQKKKMRFRQYH